MSPGRTLSMVSPAQMYAVLVDLDLIVFPDCGTKRWLVCRSMNALQSALLLLSLVAIVKAGITAPRNPGCLNTKGKNSLQNVKVNLSAVNSLNLNVNSRRPSDHCNRSTSPWSLHRNEDPERYPSVIWEAKCRHWGCVNAAGQVDHHMNSVPIQQEILVLRREPQHCPPSFRLEKMRVAVGCTCVTPIIRHMA
ncbi:interleukin-17A [Ctenodactylus gundi]